MWEHSYPGLKPLPKPKVVEDKERVPKGMVRASVYERRVGRKAFSKTK